MDWQAVGLRPNIKATERCSSCWRPAGMIAGEMRESLSRLINIGTAEVVPDDYRAGTATEDRAPGGMVRTRYCNTRF
jgi:hypothetical protein